MTDWTLGDVDPAAETRAPKRTAIVNLVRQQIVDGTLHPGEQLPPRDAILEQLGTCKATLQEAFDVLKREGFIQCEGKQGTFVAERPPHLCHYALAYGADPQGNWLGFWNALLTEVAAVELERRCRLITYTAVEDHEDNDAYQRLLADVKAHRVAGIIIPAALGPLMDSRLMDMPDVVRVVNTQEPPVTGNTVSVCGDIDAFIDKALDHFAARGRKRVALLNDYEFAGGGTERFVQGAADRGLETAPIWTHFLPARSVGSVVRLLMSLPPAQRPDALFLADSSLVAEALRTMTACNVRVGVEVDVVAHSSLPGLAPGPTPARRLGWDSRVYLNTMIDAVDRQLRGEEVPPLIKIPPVFEDEVEE